MNRRVIPHLSLLKRLRVNFQRARSHRAFSKATTFGLVLLLASFPTGALSQGLIITPTTTLAAETGNNTSSANSFADSGNGNLRAGNVSKVDIRTLLYPGATTNFYAHLMPWWGLTNHINIGYAYLDNEYPQSPTSLDPQITQQVDDMLSRGIHGAFLYWRCAAKADSSGKLVCTADDSRQTNIHHDKMAHYLRNEAEMREGHFKFALQWDGSALDPCARSLTCNMTSQLIKDLKYANEHFWNSPGYLKFDGRPVVLFFDPDRFGLLNWDRVTASIQAYGNPIFIFRNSGGFTSPRGLFSRALLTGGSFGWIDLATLDPTNWAQVYLTNFYTAGKKDPTLHTIGSVYKGFNDSLGFGAVNNPLTRNYRVMNQDCGKTWLNTFRIINGGPDPEDPQNLLKKLPSLYSESNQLESIQVNTWNDHEEGSEHESGIENCVQVGASLTGSMLNWNLVGGNETKLDHYVVFISLDGENLMPLIQPALGTTSLDLSNYALAPGTYTLHVKAIGKPMMSNRMSNAVKYTVGDLPPVASLSVTPISGSAPLTVTATAAGSDSDGVAVSTSIDFGDGTVVQDSAASHTYAKPGQYRVTASVVDNAGASSSNSVLVNATNTLPVATLSLSATSAIAGGPPIVADASGSHDPDGTLAFSRIEWGDGSPPTSGTSGSHIYNLAGNYTARSLVVDNFGVVARSTTTTVNVAGPRVTISTPTTGSIIPTAQVHVVATAIPGPSGEVTCPAVGTCNATFQILDARGSTSVRVYGPVRASPTGVLETDIFLNNPDEQHRLTVRVTDTAGVSGQSTVNLWLKNQAPVVTLSVAPSSGIVPLTVEASTAASADPDGTIVSRSLDFGDGTVDNNATASHTYSSVGKYTVTATLTDDLDGTSTGTQEVHVMYNFAGFLSPLSGAANFPVGATIPVKFSLSDANNAVVSTATAMLDVFLVGAGGALTPVPVTSNGSNTGNQFRFDPVEQQYIYGLSTAGYAKGTYMLKVSIDDQTTHQLQISLK
jgi:PKD repeat protein